MNNGETQDPASAPAPTTYTPFVPMLLTLIGLIVLLGWNLRGVVQQTRNLQAVKVQILQATLQNAQTEAKLKAMLTDLLILAPIDPDAAAIVKRYQITQNPPAAAAPAAPAPAPAVKSESRSPKQVRRPNERRK